MSKCLLDFWPLQSLDHFAHYWSLNILKWLLESKTDKKKASPKSISQFDLCSHYSSKLGAYGPLFCCEWNSFRDSLTAYEFFESHWTLFKTYLDFLSLLKAWTQRNFHMERFPQLFWSHLPFLTCTSLRVFDQKVFLWIPWSNFGMSISQFNLVILE